MRLTFLVALQNLRLPFLGGRGDQLRDGLFVTTDGSFVRGMIPQKAREAMGLLEYQSLLDSPVMHRTWESPDCDLRTALLEQLQVVVAFLHALWLHFDNSVCTELGFLIAMDDARLHTHSNSIGVSPRFADGTSSCVSLTRDELSGLRHDFRTRFDSGIGHTEPSSTLLLSDTPRLSRAFYWIQIARSAADLGERVSAYCSALESLFATSTSELSHQLAERCAFFVAKSPSERLRIYREIKKAYGFRSRIVHGDFVKRSDVEPMARLSKACDNVARAALRRAMDDEDLAEVFNSKESLDEYMLSCIFGLLPSNINAETV